MTTFTLPDYLAERLQRALDGLLGGRYTVSTEHHPQPEVRAYGVAHESRAYSVYCDLKAKKWECDCPDFEQHGREQGHCKHTFMCLLVLLRSQPPHAHLPAAEGLTQAAELVAQKLAAPPAPRPVAPAPARPATPPAEAAEAAPARPSLRVVPPPPPTPQAPPAIRLASYMTRGSFLHVEDALDIEKIRLFAGSYQKGWGASELTSHYLDLADARVLVAELARPWEGYEYREYKGSDLPSGTISRVLSVQVRADKVFVELTSGPGQRLPTGAIKPSRAPGSPVPVVKVTVAFSWHEAQRLALAVQAYLQAWEACRMAALGRTFPDYERAPQATGVAS